MADFNQEIAPLLETEGGLNTNNSDRGGLTKYGISQKSYPKLDIENLTPEKAAAIYKRDYWDKIGGDNLPPATAAVAFDAAVNHGVGKAKALLTYSGGDPQKMLGKRKQIYDGIVKHDQSQAQFHDGWMNRLGRLGGRIADMAIKPAYADETPWQQPNEADQYGGLPILKKETGGDQYGGLPILSKSDIPTPEPSAGQQVGQAITELGGGVLKGVSQVGQGAINLGGGAAKAVSEAGNTLLSAGDAYNEFVGNKNALSSLDSTHESRGKFVDEKMKNAGIDTESALYKTGQLGGEIVIGGGAAKAAGALAKGTQTFNKLAPAIESFGMKGESLAQKAIGGGIAGVASTATSNPGGAGLGGVVGALLPPGIQAAGKAGQLAGGGIAKAYNSLTMPAQEKIASKIVEATGKSKQDVIDLLTNEARSKELPELLRTVPQILQDRNISQLARTVKTNSSMALSEAEGAQQTAYKNAIESIAPSNSTVQDAADKAGSAISKLVQRDYKVATSQVSKAFNELRNNPEKNIELPIDKLQATVDQYLGKGTVGKGSGAKSALNEAANLSKPIPVEESKLILPKSFKLEAKQPALEKVGFKELQNLRSSIGDLAQQAKLAGKNTENAALKQMVSDIDTHLDDLANSADGMSSDTLKAYKEARALHKAKIDRFKTGAQAGLFKPKSNGEMAVEGGEIPGKFYSSKASQSRDIQSFKRLVADKPELVKELKEYALTKAGQTATANGNLAEGYRKWARSHSGANQELFTVGEKAKIDAVAKEIGRASSAENLGRVTGSDTAQKLKSIMDLGLIDNKMVNFLANKIPAGNALLTALKESSGRERSNMIAELLANPDKLASALGPGAARALAQRGLIKHPKAIKKVGEGALVKLAKHGVRAAPVILSR